MMEQISMLPPLSEEENAEELIAQVKQIKEYDKLKRKWENGFQKWSNEKALDGLTHYGACGYGAICGYCKDNDYGRPCVRALNEMCREKRKTIDYQSISYENAFDGKLVKT